VPQAEDTLQLRQCQQMQLYVCLTCGPGLNHKLLLNRVVLTDVGLDLLHNGTVLNLDITDLCQ
jgi:hypothetical protein